MKAFALTGFDEPPRFVDVPRPVLGSHDVLVRVLASSVNPVDRLVASGFFRTVQEYRFPAVFGRDLSGVVDEVGPAVTRFAPGQRVWGFVKREHIGNGTFAEYVAVPEDHFAVGTPAELSSTDAGVLGLSSVTALECVDAVSVAPGDTVFVNGATGGIGSFAVQIAAAQGLTVVAAARPGRATEHARAMGAAHVVDWTTRDLAEQVRQLVPEGVDGFIEVARHAPPTAMGVGEEEKQQRFGRLAQEVLRPGGSAASTTNGGNPEFLGDVVCVNVHSTPTPLTLQRINDLIASGKVVAPIQEAFPFDQIADAFERLLAGQILGKISISMATSSA